jgi:hypothetical protein
MDNALKFDAEFFPMPDGSVTAIVRALSPWAKDVVETLGHSERRGPKRVTSNQTERSTGGGHSR